MRIHNNSSLLISRVFESIYRKSPVAAGLSSEIHHKASWGYRGLCKSVKDSESGFGRTICKGDTNMNQTNWLPSRKVQIKDQNIIESQRISGVKDLFSDSAKQWNASLIWKCFSADTANKIMSLHISQENCNDQCHWMSTKNGQSMVKSVYNFLIMGKPNQFISKDGKFWKRLWKSDLLPKWKIFIWKLMHNALAVKNKLKKRGMEVNTLCVLCKDLEENETHLFTFQRLFCCHSRLEDFPFRK